MKWNLRLVAAQHEIWKASELQTMLGEAGLVISAGKMSGLWSGHPSSFKGTDLDVICAVLNCNIGDLLTPETQGVVRVDRSQENAVVNATQHLSVVTPRKRSGRSLPPV